MSTNGFHNWEYQPERLVEHAIERVLHLHAWEGQVEVTSFLLNRTATRMGITDWEKHLRDLADRRNIYLDIVYDADRVIYLIRWQPKALHRRGGPS